MNPTHAIVTVLKEFQRGLRNCHPDDSGKILERSVKRSAYSLMAVTGASYRLVRLMAHRRVRDMKFVVSAQVVH